MSNESGQGTSLEIAGIGHDDEGAYVDVRGLFNFVHPSEVARLRIGDTVGLQPRALFNWTLNGEDGRSTVQIEEAVA